MTRRLRLLMVSDHYPPYIGGAHRQTALLARLLTARGHDVTVATTWHGGLAEYERDGAVPVHRLRQLRTAVPSVIRAGPQRHQPPFADPISTWQLRRILDDVAPDLVHSYGWFTYTVAAALFRRPTPLVVSARDYAYSCATRTLMHEGHHCTGPSMWKCLACSHAHYGAPKGEVAAATVRLSASRLRKRVDGIHSVSRFVAQIVERDFLAHGGRIRDIPHVVIPSFLVHGETGAPEAEAGPLPAALEGDPFVLFVGALRREKGIEELLAAYRSLDAPPRLVLMGTIERDTPRSFPPGVEVVERAPHAVVMAAWDRCLFGVLPSRWPEPFGSVVYEGMSRGKAVIGTRPGGHEDMIDDGRNGLLVPAGDAAALADAMRSLIADEDLRTRLGIAAARAVTRFTDEIAVPQFEELYERVLDRTSRR